MFLQSFVLKLINIDHPLTFHNISDARWSQGSWERFESRTEISFEKDEFCELIQLSTVMKKLGPALPFQELL